MYTFSHTLISPNVHDYPSHYINTIVFVKNILFYIKYLSFPPFKKSSYSFLLAYISFFFLSAPTFSPFIKPRFLFFYRFFINAIFSPFVPIRIYNFFYIFFFQTFPLFSLYSLLLLSVFLKMFCQNEAEHIGLPLRNFRSWFPCSTAAVSLPNWIHRFFFYIICLRVFCKQLYMISSILI